MPAVTRPAILGAAISRKPGFAVPSRSKAKGRRESGSFLLLPHAVLNSANCIALSAYAKALLLDIAAQYKGSNNGDLAACWRLMQPRGWKSRDTLSRALRELIHFGLIDLARQGGLHRASLYALTWRAVDNCNGKLDVSATSVASNRWRETVGSPPPTKKRQHVGRVNVTRLPCQSRQITEGIDTPTVSVIEKSA
jgi:hypothetical protein